jgi:hypothetical protein
MKYTNSGHYFCGFRAHHAILQKIAVFSDLKKMAENMQPKSESGYKFIALTNYDKC